MAPASRATGAPVTLYQVGSAGKAGSKLRRASEISLNTPGLDLATKVRVFQRALRSRVERRGALLDIVRAVNTVPYDLAHASGRLTTMEELFRQYRPLG